jgi:branched-subunit amino acid aminotransferase/4-amino-4-deoxychorismate lyase
LATDPITLLDRRARERRLVQFLMARTDGSVAEGGGLNTLLTFDGERAAAFAGTLDERFF